MPVIVPFASTYGTFYLLPTTGEDIPLKELNLTFINDFEYFLNMHEYTQQKEQEISAMESRLNQLKQNKNPDSSGKLRLSLNGQNILYWFKQKYQEVKQTVRPNIKPIPPQQKRGQGYIHYMTNINKENEFYRKSSFPVPRKSISDKSSEISLRISSTLPEVTVMTEVALYR